MRKNFWITSDLGVRFIERWEGKRNCPYDDSGGALSIGIGHLITDSERKSGKIYIKKEAVLYKNWLSEDQIYNLLDQDLVSKERDVSIALYDSSISEWTQNQADALISMVFNIGITAFRKSTLRKRLISGDIEDVPNQINRWVYDNGVVIKGLVNRRKAEAKLFNEGVYK